MTPAECASGTDRIAHAARSWDAAAIVNIQGDEPLIDPEAVALIAGHLRDHPGDPMVTLAAPALDDEPGNPNAVKVVLDLAGYALYFSRSPIPYPASGRRGPAAQAPGNLRLPARDAAPPRRAPSDAAGAQRIPGAAPCARERHPHPRAGNRARLAGRRHPGRPRTRRALAPTNGNRLLGDLMATKYIFITGGVVSSLGKGIAAASIGALLEARGFTVTLMKFDPYINVDPGTMSPFQHGEVFVTDDGAETDLDLGHYERFTHMRSPASATTTPPAGSTPRSSRRSAAATTSARPSRSSPTSPTRSRRPCAGSPSDDDVVIVEIGGTVGDIESLPFLEAIRQFRQEIGRGNAINVHLTLVPYIAAADELKTKPTQHSVRELREIGISADILLCRSDRAAARGHEEEDRALLQRRDARRHRRARRADHLRGAAGVLPRGPGRDPPRAAEPPPRRPRPLPMGEPGGAGQEPRAPA